MGSTPRAHRFQVPLATRSTDIDSLAQCPGSWLLRLIHEKDQMPASYFILGSQLHESIEVAINLDLDEDWAVRHLTAGLEREIERVGDGPVLESSKRGMDTIIEDGQRMLSNWFRFTHPDSPKRHPAYDSLVWPPATEVPFQRNDGPPVWGQVDAIFDVKNSERKALVDWKSSSSKQKSSEQLWFYAYGLGLPDADAWFHNVDRVQLRAVIQKADPYPGDAHVIERATWAQDTKQRILDSGRVQFEPSFLCNYCPVRSWCPKEGDNTEANLAALTRAMRLLRPMDEIPEAA